EIGGIGFLLVGCVGLGLRGIAVVVRAANRSLTAGLAAIGRIAVLIRRRVTRLAACGGLFGSSTGRRIAFAALGATTFAFLIATLAGLASRLLLLAGVASDLAAAGFVGSSRTLLTGAFAAGAIVSFLSACLSRALLAAAAVVAGRAAFGVALA